MRTDANSIINRILDGLSDLCVLLFGPDEKASKVGADPHFEPRPPIANVDVRIAISEAGFHYVHAVIDNEFVFTSTSQKGGLIPIDRSLTPVDLHGNVDQRIAMALTAMLKAHTEWAAAGRPERVMDKAILEKVDAKLNPSAASPRGPRPPKKSTPDFDMEGHIQSDDSISLTEMREFFESLPKGPIDKR